MPILSCFFNFANHGLRMPNAQVISFHTLPLTFAQPMPQCFESPTVRFHLCFCPLSLRAHTGSLSSLVCSASATSDSFSLLQRALALCKRRFVAAIHASGTSNLPHKHINPSKSSKIEPITVMKWAARGFLAKTFVNYFSYTFF